MTALAATRLTAGDARTLTDQVKADAAALWAQLLHLYEGEAHLALGYSSWGAYYEAEFGQSGTHGYRLLDSARVLEALPDSHSPMGERALRELAPLKDEPELLQAAYEEAVKRSNGKPPTAATVKEVVNPPKPKPDLVGDAIKRIPELPDETFSVVIDMVDELRQCPSPEDVWLPPDAGNRRAFDDALQWLSEWLPQMAAVWRREVPNPSKED